MELRKTPIYIATGLLVTFGAFAQDNSAATSSNASSSNSAATAAKSTKGSDAKFAQEAAIGGMAEVEMGKLAVQKAQNDQVKQFGQRMIDDHSKAGDELKALASKENITLPTEIDAKHKATINKLSALSGAAFDHAYMSDMVKDHQHDVADFQKEASNGSNTDLKGWASKTLPTLQDHLRMAQETSKGIGAMTSK